MPQWVRNFKDNAKDAIVEGMKNNAPGIIWFVSAVLLYFIDWFITLFNGVDPDKFLSTFQSGYLLWHQFLWTWWTMAAILIIVAYIVFARPNKQDIPSFAALIMITALILSTQKSMGIGAVLHLMFAFFALFYMLYPQMEKSQANVLVIILIIVDFILFPFAKKYLHLEFISRLTIPIWVLVTTAYTRPSLFKRISVFVIIMFYIFSLPAAYFAYNNWAAQLTDVDKTQAKEFGNTAWQNFKEFGTNLNKGLFASYNNTRRIISGEDFIASQTDGSVKEPLGVFLEQVKSTDEKYEAGDTVYVYGRLRVASIEEGIKANVYCYAKDAYGNVTQGETITGHLELYNKEEMDIVCTLKNMQKGSYTVGINVTYNFTTFTTLKTYFMNLETKRAMDSKDVDIFASNKITDTKPISIVTPGPIELALATTETLPIGISRTSNSETNLFIKMQIKNLNDGKIKKINSVQLFIPKGLSIEASKCNANFVGMGDTEVSSVYNIDNAELDRASLSEITTKLFICNLNIGNYDDLMRNTEITKVSTRYFRTNMTYTYMIQKSTSVTVKEKKTVTNTATLKKEGESCAIGSGTCGKCTYEALKITNNNECDSSQDLSCCKKAKENEACSSETETGTCKTVCDADTIAITADQNQCETTLKCCKPVITT